MPWWKEELSKLLIDIGNNDATWLDVIDTLKELIDDDD